MVETKVLETHDEIMRRIEALGERCARAERERDAALAGTRTVTKDIRSAREVADCAVIYARQLGAATAVARLTPALNDLCTAYDVELLRVTRALDAVLAQRDVAQGKIDRFVWACESLTHAERAFRKVIEESQRRSLCSPEEETARATWLAAYEARNAASAERDAALAALREGTPR